MKARSYEFIAIIRNYFPFIVLPTVVLWLGIQDEINKFFGCTIRTEYFFVESVTCRGDTASVINLYYYTEESINREKEPESIRIGSRIWQKFEWDTFQWLTVNWAYTFRRKCSLKKIQMCSFYFENDEVNRDMSISHIALQYQIVKNIK